MKVWRVSGKFMVLRFRFPNGDSNSPDDCCCSESDQCDMASFSARVGMRTVMAPLDHILRYTHPKPNCTHSQWDCVSSPIGLGLLARPGNTVVRQTNLSLAFPQPEFNSKPSGAGIGSSIRTTIRKPLAPTDIVLSKCGFDCPLLRTMLRRGRLRDGRAKLASGETCRRCE